MFDQSAELYDLFYESQDYRAESEHVWQLVVSRQPEARSLLDVACGTGKHLEQLAQWFTVEGLDLDLALLEIAATRLPGVPLHRADMRDFDLGRTFDVVTCLGSSIGAVKTPDGLAQAVQSMTSHLDPGGLLIIEPWLTPTTFDPQHLGRAMLVEGPGMRAVRMNGARVEGSQSVLDFHYLVARPGTVEHLTETHRLGLFTNDEYRSVMEGSGLAVEHDPEGLMGRGLWIGVKAARNDPGF